MQYGEDWWTPEEAEDGLMPHNAVWDPANGIYRQVLEDEGDQGEDLFPRSPLRSGHKARTLTAAELGLTDEEDKG
jgi:hypothetical protein